MSTPPKGVAGAPKAPVKGMGSTGDLWKPPPKLGRGVRAPAAGCDPKAETTCPMGVAGCDGNGALKELAGGCTGGPSIEGGAVALTKACALHGDYLLQSGQDCR
jgi:hypothetical protein